MPTPRPAAAAALVMLLTSGAALAQEIDPIAYGHDLFGATISVEFHSLTESGVGPGPTLSASLLTIGPELGHAVIPGLFDLTMQGNTFFDPWRIRNLSSDLYISRVLIDLTDAGGVFDDNSSPSSIGSNEGIPGILYLSDLSTAAAPSLSRELEPWDSPLNAGDLYLQQEILWDAGAFGPQQSVWFMDDTDLRPGAAPTPGPVVLLVTAGAAAVRRRRR